MSHFEFVSVALSLVYALAIAEVLGNLAPALRPSVRYWPHFIWLSVFIPIITFAWWATWNMRSVEWTGLRFLYFMMVPSLLYVLPGLLGERARGPIHSYRAMFERNRRYFFALFIFYMANGALTPWVSGVVPVGEFAPVQASTLPGIALGVAGIVSKSPRTLSLLGLAAWALALAALALTPIRGLGA